MYKSSYKNELFLLFIFIILNIFSIYIAQHNFQNKFYHILFLPILKVMFFISFFHLGNMYKEYWEEKDNLFSCFKLFIPLSINFIIATFFCGESQTLSRLDEFAFDSSWMNFPNKNILIPIITSICGIYFWLNISKIIANNTKDTDFIYTIGKNTFNIMTHHIFMFWLINSIFYYFCSDTVLSELDFNAISYKHDVWYKVTNFWPFMDYVYVVISIIGSILIGSMFNKLKKYFIVLIKL